jgi:hypothetical protein
MFWSTVINPPRADHKGSVIVWDSARAVVQGRDLQNSSNILWQLNNVNQGDCITVIPDRNYIYMTDYSSSPKHSSDWLAATTGDIEEFRVNSKFFILADTRNGQVIFNISLAEHGYGTNPSLLVPGKNNDVFIGVPKGVVRIYTDKK